MDIFKSTSFVFLIVCIQGLAFVNAGFEDATTIHDCLETLKDDSIHGGQPCSVMPEYVKCAIKTTGVMKTLSTSEAIQQFQRGVEAALQTAGLYCSIDVSRIVDELRAEGYTGESTRDPNKKLTYENAENVEECVEAAGQKNIPCSQISDFLKCNARTEGALDLLNTPGAIETFEDTMTETLRNLGVYCDFDMHKIIEELKAEAKTGVHNVQTVSEPKTGIDNIHSVYGDAAPVSGNQQHRGPTYKVHHSYYQRNAGVSTTMKGLNLGYMAIITVLTTIIAYIR